MSKLAPIAKSITAGFAAGLGSLATAATDDRITAGEWIAAAAVALAAAAAVWGIPNSSPGTDAGTY